MPVLTLDASKPELLGGRCVPVSTSAAFACALAGIDAVVSASADSAAIVEFASEPTSSLDGGALCSGICDACRPVGRRSTCGSSGGGGGSSGGGGGGGGGGASEACTALALLD